MFGGVNAKNQHQVFPAQGPEPQAIEVTFYGAREQSFHVEID